jgi:hypothetical protein
MTKENKKLDILKLQSTFVPNTRGSDGEDPKAEAIKRHVQAGNTEKAHALFATFHDNFHGKPNHDWLEDVRDKSKDEKTP